jgi:hypothetical protein
MLPDQVTDLSPLVPISIKGKGKNRGLRTICRTLGICNEAPRALDENEFLRLA